MKIALLQLEVLEKNKAANVAHGLQLAVDAAISMTHRYRTCEDCTLLAARQLRELRQHR